MCASVLGAGISWRGALSPKWIQYSTSTQSKRYNGIRHSQQTNAMGLFIFICFDISYSGESLPFVRISSFFFPSPSSGAPVCVFDSTPLPISCCRPRVHALGVFLFMCYVDWRANKHFCSRLFLLTRNDVTDAVVFANGCMRKQKPTAKPFFLLLLR